ncbi:phosphatase PAP2 family protein [Pontibacter anaerobius]|uniref:Phosphatase PAP2 family protein n=1 Tax=Pontibacter anaerobius TaxID=2993940 RepID=A0ABT3REQ7_9BACT|nr:phosphatase PAP2 family protein [Pontibacter anaerobius]MCX2740025.1 phosphatase PAP2 family protein [Pontibacter anaerobius]
MIRSFYKRMMASTALFTVELIFVWLLFLVCIIGFLYLGSEVLEGDTEGLDEAAFNFAASLGNPYMDGFIKFVTFFASRQFLTPMALALVAYYLFVRKHRWNSLKVPVVALGSITLNIILKYFFDRERPMSPLVEASGLSFPSGHSMVAASFYGLLIYLVWHNVKNVHVRNTLIVLLSVFVVLIGFSRIYLRVHYASDVLAGFSAGFLWVIIGITTLRRIERFSGKEITPIVLEEHEEKK